MNKNFPTILATLIVFLSLAFSGTAGAAGLLIADGGFGGVLEIKKHEVEVTVNNGIAVTNVTQVFHNTENRQVEALYTFPVPKGASVANFSMWINGKEIVGEVLEKERARQIYNSYKRKRRDPGLLEQVDYKTFEMRIFPINAGADQNVAITYYQEIDVDHDRAVYVYPLATVTRRDIDSRTTGTFSMNVEIKSAVPIVEMESPSHGEAFVIAGHTDLYSTASLEASSGSLADDVVVSYNFSRPQTGIDLIPSRRDREDGYFLLTLTAGKELAELDEGMDYVFVMDISGSMGDDSKLIMSKNSVEAFVNELGADDRFEVMTFNVSPDTLFGDLRPATADMKEVAREYMNSQKARGGTVLAPAMNRAYQYGEADRTLNVVILSDGMTEQRERQTLIQLIQTRPRNARVFCIGIGNEVNRPLLEQMAEDSGGLAAFVSHGDNFKAQAKGFRRKLSHPAATDLRIGFEGIRVYDVEPAVLPNLYHGSPLRIYGRYSGSGEATITLQANVQGRELKQDATLVFPENDTDNPEIERMWAWKRIDQLLKKADRTGSRQAVIDEIVSLGEEYSIVTEYTSFLVLENDGEYRRWKIERKNRLRFGRDREAQAQRRKELDEIRNLAVTELGPQHVVKEKTVTGTGRQQRMASVPNTSNPGARSNSATPQNGRGWDFDFGGGGSGPVGPLFLAGAYWLSRRKKKKQH
ncbi:MAG: VWA domain-containing protein [Nitrospiraceae bacterium]|nr:MAG: VWA domain-containing protein [Nitrospiraceae bacterium]